MNRALVLVAFLLALAPSVAAPLSAQEVCTLPVVGADRLGPATLVTRDGPYLYVFAGRALLVLDASGPAEPAELGRVDLDFDLFAIDAAGPLLAGAAGELGVALVDVSDPALPRLRSVRATPGGVYSVDVRGSLVFAADQSVEVPNPLGLLVLDAADPVHPTVVATRPFGAHGATDVAVRGDTAFVIDWDDVLHLLDVSDPSDPRALGQIGLNPGFHELHVSADGRLAFVWWLFANHNGGAGVEIVDTSDRTQPVRRSVFGYDNDAELGIRTIGIGVDRLYVSGYDYEGGRFWVYDVADPSQPTLVGEIVGTPLIEGLARLGTRVFGAAGDRGVLVVDAANPAAPQVVAERRTSGRITDVALDHGVALLRTTNELRTVDVHDPAHPVPLGRTDALELGSDDPAAEGFVAASTELALLGNSTGLQVVDVSDPALPTPRSFVPLGDEFGPACALIRGTVAFVGLYPTEPSPRLLVFDLSDPDAPVQIGAYGGASFSACPLALEGDRLLAGNDCRILDVSDPAVPVALGTCPADARRAAFEGSTAYLGNSDALLIYDVSDPANPAPLGGAFLPVRDLDVEHSRAWVATYAGNVLALDLRDPTQPLLAGLASPPLAPSKLDAESGTLLVANGSRGYTLLADCPFFGDGFESGDTSAWSGTTP